MVLIVLVVSYAFSVYVLACCLVFTRFGCAWWCLSWWLVIVMVFIVIKCLFMLLDFCCLGGCWYWFVFVFVGMCAFNGLRLRCAVCWFICLPVLVAWWCVFCLVC